MEEQLPRVASAAPADLASREETPSSPAGPAAAHPPLKPPTVSLRGLMAGMAVVCVLLAVFNWAGALAALIALLIALAIGAHVAGNAIGTQLRGDVSRPRRAPSPGQPRPQIPAAPATQLQKRHSLARPLVAAAITGGILGAAAGALYFGVFDSASATIADTLLGALAFGLLGAMAAGVATGFALVAWKAWREAVGKA